MVRVNNRTGLVNYLMMKLYPRLNPLQMLVQARNQNKGVDTKRTQVGDTDPAVVCSTCLEKWSPDEEFQLSKVCVDVSEDPIVGRNQKGPDFWRKIQSKFFQTMGREKYRTNDMIYSKWRYMNQKKRQTRRSGQSDAMIENESEDQYQEEFNAPFTLKRSWEIMRKCHNWVRIPTVQTSASKRSKASSTDSPGTSDARVQINLNELDEEKEDDDDIEDLIVRLGEIVQKPTEQGRDGALHLKRPRIITKEWKTYLNELKREHQRLVELQLLFTNTEHLIVVDREIAKREKEKIRNKYRDN
ncbi:hypothetical protein R6Q57_010419 [Mikania cordata]